jgi:outer membrane protein
MTSKPSSFVAVSLLALLGASSSALAQTTVPGGGPASPPSAAAVLAELDSSQPGTVRLSIEKVVELAMSQQASLRSARANAEASQARIALSRVPLRPTVSVGASLSAGSSGVRPCTDDPTQSCGGVFDPSSSTNFSAQASWLLYDFGQTAASIRAAEANAAASDASVLTTVLDVRTSAELAYLESVARHHLVLVAQATVDSELAHLEQARGFVNAGARDPIEVAQAQSRVASARSSLAQAQSNQAVALGNLRAAIGWVDPTRQVVTELTWPSSTGEAAPLELARLVESARAKRPEIVQFDKQIAAAEASVDSVSASRRPTLSAFASTQWGPDSNDWTPDPAWSAGLQLSWTAFDGGRAAAEAKIAKAQLRATIAQRDALLVSLTSGLETARARIVANAANVQASSEAVVAAQAALRLAEARYAQGLGSQIEVADAQSAVTVAQGNVVVAEWQLADAWAQLRRAVGG